MGTELVGMIEPGRGNQAAECEDRFLVKILFLPASLISAIFGMNVGGLPLEHDRGGFVWAIGILVVASGLVFWILRRLGLFRR
jgi:zinc transporter